RHELCARRGRPLHRDPGHGRAGTLQAGRDGADAQARHQGRRRAGRGSEEGAEAALNRLLLATTNPGKLKELRAILGELPMELVSPTDVGIVFDVVEDGASYLENAREKAEAGRRLTGLPTLADDSGLEVPSTGRRLEELSTEEKNLLSHRARALNALEVHGAFDAALSSPGTP